MKLLLLKKLTFSFLVFFGFIKIYSQTTYELNAIILEHIIPNNFIQEYKIEINNSDYYKKLTSNINVKVTKYNSNFEKVTVNKKLSLKIYRQIEKELLNISPKDILFNPSIVDDSGQYFLTIESLSGTIKYRFSNLNLIPKNSSYENLKNAFEIIIKLLELNS
jgi:hypothetical protein